MLAVLSSRKTATMPCSSPLFVYNSNTYYPLRPPAPHISSAKIQVHASCSEFLSKSPLACWQQQRETTTATRQTHLRPLARLVRGAALSNLEPALDLEVVSRVVNRPAKHSRCVDEGA